MVSMLLCSAEQNRDSEVKSDGAGTYRPAMPIRTPRTRVALRVSLDWTRKIENKKSLSILRLLILQTTKRASYLQKIDHTVVVSDNLCLLFVDVC